METIGSSTTTDAGAGGNRGVAERDTHWSTKKHKHIHTPNALFSFHSSIDFF
jgi:hypothetical protein